MILKPKKQNYGKGIQQKMNWEQTSLGKTHMDSTSYMMFRRDIIDDDDDDGDDDDADKVDDNDDDDDDAEKVMKMMTLP